MINLKITKYRDFTAEERAERKELEENRRKYSVNNFDETRPYNRDRVVDGILDVEITNEQWEAIRKAVLENF